MEIFWGLNVGEEDGEEIIVKSMGIIKKGKGVVKVAAKLVVVRGDARWARGVDESTANLN